MGFHLSSHGYQISWDLIQNECPSFWVLNLVGEPAHLTTLTIVIGIPLYQSSLLLQPRGIVLPKHTQENGPWTILCCLAKERVELVLQVTQQKENYCEMKIQETVLNMALQCYYFESKLN